MAKQDQALDKEEKLHEQGSEESAEGLEDQESAEQEEELVNSEDTDTGAEDPEAFSDASEDEGETEVSSDIPEIDKGSRKSIFSKKEKKDRKDKTDPLKEQIKELNDRCMRQMAEFENFRKRTDREKTQMFDTGAAHVIEKILPVVDNFERGLAATSEADKGSPLAEGMDKIYKQLYRVLEDLGVTPIEALGKEFDPNFHNAVMQTEASEEFPSGTVSQEMQKGYLYHDTVIRHSMVAVAE